MKHFEFYHLFMIVLQMFNTNKTVDIVDTIKETSILFLYCIILMTKITNTRYIANMTVWLSVSNSTARYSLLQFAYTYDKETHNKPEMVIMLNNRHGDNIYCTLPFCVDFHISGINECSHFQTFTMPSLEEVTMKPWVVWKVAMSVIMSWWPTGKDSGPRRGASSVAPAFCLL